VIRVATAAGPAAAVRRGRLRQRPRGPVQEPFPPVLRHDVREPHQRRRLPGAAGRPRGV